MSSNTVRASASPPLARGRDHPLTSEEGCRHGFICQESSVVYERVELTFTGGLDVVDPSHAISRPSTTPGVSRCRSRNCGRLPYASAVPHLHILVSRISKQATASH